MKRFYKSLLLIGVLVLPAIAYAVTVPIRVTVSGRPTDYQAIMINGKTYIALKDVAALTGRSVTFNASTKTVDFTGPSATPISGPAEIAPDTTIVKDLPIEGPRGGFLTIPEVSLFVKGVTYKKLDGVAYLIANGLVRNTSNDSKTYWISDAKMVFKDGTTVPFALQSKELNGAVYAKLERGEESKLKILFPTGVAPEEIDELVITIRAGRYSDGLPKVFHVKF